MIIKSKFTPSPKHFLLLIVLLVVTALSSLVLLSSSASAEPVIVDPVQQYCLNNAPKAAKEACAGTNNINIKKARYAASYNCTDEPVDGNLKANCIVKYAKQYIATALAVKPKASRPEVLVNRIQREIDKDTSKTGGSSANPSPDSVTVVSHSTATIHRSAVQPGALPKPPTNAATIKNMFGVVFGILGAFALLMITISGLKYITAGGDPQQASEAKKGVIYSLVGLAIAISAESIVVFLVNRV